MITVARFGAPPHWRAIDFISDLHLSPALPRTFEAWRTHLLGTAADAVFILGDLFEVWVGDDARHEPFEARCVETMRQASRRLTLGVMVGNRDFLIGSELLDACSALALVDPTLVRAFGEQVLVTHGDAWCIADVDYQEFRGVVRSADWQREFLARPLDERQRIAAEIRRGSESRKRFDGSMSADVDAATAAAALQAAGTSILVHGHTHRPFSGPLGEGITRHVLSDWDLDNGRRAEVLRWTRDGLRRTAPEGMPA